MKEFKKNLLAMAFSLIVLFLFFEITLRFFLASPTYPVKELAQSSNQIIAYELKKNMDIIDNGGFWKLEPVHVTTNADGYRDREHTYSKTSDVFRIAVIGDSITFAQYANQDDGYVNQLEEKLSKNGNYELLNFGVPGYNTLQEAEVFKERALRYSPDMVILQFVANDFEKTFNPISSSTFVEQARKMLRHSYTFRFVYWYYYKAKNSLNSGAQTNAVLDRDSESWQRVEQAIRKMDTLADEEQITFVLMTMPVYYRDPFYDAYSGEMKKLSEELGIYYVDLGDLFKDYPEEKLIIPKEGHPNRFAHGLIANAIYQNLTSYGLI